MHNTDPEIQIHRYDEHTFILRQNMAVDYEAPFLFLMFGNESAVLIDTGATSCEDFFPLRRVVDRIIEEWTSDNPRDAYRLVVLHTHPHEDHVAGDVQFLDRPLTSVIGAERVDSWRHFGFEDDEEAVATVDLGGRALECFATPGHHEASVTFYDPWTGFLLTGDTIYPGRLYIDDWESFGRSVDRMIRFCSRRRITHVLGCHIEMTATPGVDYPVRTTHQPDEPPLELNVGHLHEIRAALDEVGARPRRHVLPRFVLWPELDVEDG
ncbi:MBL fold metallo-hydrolase [Streptomyces sp. NPDC055607]